MVASRRAVSLASVPEVVKNTRASGMPDSAAISSASSIIGSDRYSVEVCITLAAWSCTAATTSGLAVPDHRGEHAAEEVEVAVALDVVDVAALAAARSRSARRTAG